MARRTTLSNSTSSHYSVSAERGRKRDPAKAIPASPIRRWSDRLDCVTIGRWRPGGHTEDINVDLTAHWAGFAAVIIFVLGYALVVTEEFTSLRKSKPMILASGIIWTIIGIQYAGSGLGHAAEEAVEHFLIEFAELFLFLLTAMTYVNAMTERRILDALRSWLVHHGFSYRRLFWVTGIISFFLSPIIDNMTTALVMSAVILAVGRGNVRFVSIACINIVVAANAGGAFSPFGDITTLMVWQKGILDFHVFFKLLIPSVVNYLIPATIMSFAIPQGRPASGEAVVTMKRVSVEIMFLFACTIATASFLSVFCFCLTEETNLGQISLASCSAAVATCFQ